MDPKLQVADLKAEVRELRSGGIPLNLTPVSKYIHPVGTALLRCTTVKQRLTNTRRQTRQFTERENINQSIGRHACLPASSLT